MEGSDILVCDGERWNGSVPHCNGEDYKIKVFDNNILSL